MVEQRREFIFWSFLAAALAAWVVAFPLTNTDIWWHLAGGRTILEQGLPERDTYSLSSRDAPWVNVHWAFQVAAFAVWSWGGVLGLVLAKAITVALGAVVLIAATGARARGVAVLVLVVLLFAARHLVMARPIVVSLLLLAGFSLGLERYRRYRSRRALLSLPVLQILWVNVQGLHVLGPVLVLCYLAGAATQRFLDGRWSMPWQPLVAVAGAVTAASLVSPYGASAALLPWKLLARIDPNVGNVFAVHVAEFVPPWHLERVSPGTVLHLSLFLVLLALSFLWSRHRVVWQHLAVVIPFTVLALMAHRNLLLLYWLGAPILAANLTRGQLRPPRWLLPAAIGVVAAIVVPARTGRLDRPAPFRVPELSAALLAGWPGGNLFCSVRYGGYLAWTLHPTWTPYIDGRLVLRTREQFVEYLEVLERPSRFDHLHHRFSFDAVVLPTALPERYLSLAVYLIDHPDWVLAHTDGTEVLLLPRGAGVPPFEIDVDALLLHLRARYRGEEWAGACRHLARLLIALGEPEAARRALSVAGSGPTARSLLATTYYLDGDLDLAAASAHRLLAERGDDANSLNLLALIAVDRGHAAEALGYLRRVLAVDPYDPRARELLRRLEEEER